jgi:hypothetical protein
MGKVNPRTLKRMLARPGVHIEISAPFPIQGGRFMCLAKLVGHKRRLPRLPYLASVDSMPAPAAADDFETEPDPDATETLVVVSEEGATAGEAKRRLMRRLGDARNLPTAPPPLRPRPGWLGRLIAAFK